MKRVLRRGAQPSACLEKDAPIRLRDAYVGRRDDVLEVFGEPEFSAEVTKPRLPVRNDGERDASSMKLLERLKSIGKYFEALRAKYCPEGIGVVGGDTRRSVDAQPVEHADGESSIVCPPVVERG